MVEVRGTDGGGEGTVGPLLMVEVVKELMEVGKELLAHC